MSPQYNSQNKLARSNKITDYPVLIVGGSLVGLSTALFLSSHGIPSILIERHQSTSNHPRAAGYNLRTMELFRSVGLEQIIHDAGLNLTGSGGILVVESLTGKEIGWFEPPYHKYSNKDILQISPVKRWGVCAQDVLEPILRKRIEEIGIADLRFNNELLSFEEHKEECVNTLVKERSSDHKYRVRAQYMIAADGSKSFVRDKLAIKTHGPGTLIHLIGIYFHSDLSKYTRGRKFAICHVNNELVNGTIAGYGNNRYVLNVVYYPEKGQTIWDFTEQRCIDDVQSAVGVSELEVEIKSTLPWELGAYSADQFQKGRVFLVTGKDSIIWHKAADKVSNYLGIKIDTYMIGEDDKDDCKLVDIDRHFYKRFAVSFDGAVLIRLDGYIAWRSKSLENHKQDSATKKLSNIISSLLFATSRRITARTESISF